MEDQLIIALFFDRSEQAIVKTDKKYGGYCYSIAYNILSNRENSEESASDTYLAAVNVIFFQCDCCYRIGPESVPGGNG